MPITSDTHSSNLNIVEYKWTYERVHGNACKVVI